MLCNKDTFGRKRDTYSTRYTSYKVTNDEIATSCKNELEKDADRCERHYNQNGTITKCMRFGKPSKRVELIIGPEIMLVRYTNKSLLRVGVYTQLRCKDCRYKSYISKVVLRSYLIATASGQGGTERRLVHNDDNIHVVTQPSGTAEPAGTVLRKDKPDNGKILKELSWKTRPNECSPFSGCSIQDERTTRILMESYRRCVLRTENSNQPSAKRNVRLQMTSVLWCMRLRGQAELMRRSARLVFIPRVESIQLARRKT